MPDRVGRLHALVSSVANRLSGHGAPLRRGLSPFYGRVLHLLAGGRGLPTVINGETFRIHPQHRAALPAVYEPQLLEIMRARLQPGDCVFDIGANLGIWVLHAARLVGTGGRVVAFEPNPATAGVLRRHVRMNRVERQVTVEPVALAARGGTARLFGAVRGAGTSRLDAANPGGAAPHIEVDVEVTTLDDYCRRSGRIPSLVLIDVEGFEIDVLEGGAGTLAAHPATAVIVEMHPTLWPSGGADRMRAALERAGRRARPISGQNDAIGSYGHVVLDPGDDPRRRTGMAEKTAFPVTKTEEEWRAQLTPEQFAVLREHATERPGSCALLQEKRPGTFSCAGCGQPLFVATHKFESGTGWPSFFEPLEGSIGTTVDRSHFMVRTEVHCSRCGGHLGHVFDDGPPPTGLRYCINGVALTFEPAKA